jgi:hypothetical protein
MNIMLTIGTTPTTDLSDRLLMAFNMLQPVADVPASRSARTRETASMVTRF